MDQQTPTQNKTQILDYIGFVYEEAKECKLHDAYFAKVDEQLSFLAEYFHCSKSQTLFISMVFALNYKGDSVDIRDLIEYFDCNPMRILTFNDDINYLKKSGIFKKVKTRSRPDIPGTNDQYILDRAIAHAVLNNELMPAPEAEKNEDIITIIEQIYKLGSQRDEEEIRTIELFHLADTIIEKNIHLPLMKKIHQLPYCIKDKYLYLYLIWKTISGNESIDLGQALEEIYEKASSRLGYMQKMLSGHNPLIKNNHIELVDAQFFNDTEIKLSDKSLELLNTSGIKLFNKQKKKENIIYPKDIAPRKLIYNEEEMRQLNLLKQLMDNKKLKATQERLKAKGLPLGVTVLLHGSPGTGKTETVKQIAKSTNREIMKVDMSKTKSMWFGESQKIVKRIFTDYSAFAKTCKRTPILLFNEADALISKRVDSDASSISQTENSIQNILLEELENFEGILMATTNLAENLDSAFERRFLFKVKFHKPNARSKAQIWKDKLRQLSLNECETLAQGFDFSGGQIENIVRKAEIHEILHGGNSAFKEIMEFCLSELMVESKVQIGFVKA
jgi:AAA+ superfamily predicted ATPase